MRILTLFLVFLLLPSIAVAGPYGVSGIFSTPATDKSVALLGYIFGSHVGSVYLGGAASIALVHMFQLLNIIALSLGTLIVSYIGVVSTINTAQEGQVMGKKFGSSWIHMRGVVGMLIMVPTPTTGYSIIQSTIMWLILQGIGAADQLWSTVLTDLSTGLSTTAAVKLQDANRQAYDDLYEVAEPLTKQLLRSAVCMDALNTPGLMEWENKRIAWYHGRKTETATATGFRVTGSTYIGIPGDQNLGDVCGSYAISGEANRTDWGDQPVDDATVKATAENIYHQKQLALHFMFFDALHPVSLAIVNETAEPRSPGPLDTRLIAPFDNQVAIQPAGGQNKAINAYINILGGLSKPQQMDALKNVIQAGKQDGWIAAGSFYFTLNLVENTILFPSAFAAPQPHNIPICDTVITCSEAMPDHVRNVLNPSLIMYLPNQNDQQILGTRLWDAHIYLENDNTLESGILTTRERDFGPQTLSEYALENILPYFTQDNTDPIIAQGQFGLKLMQMSEDAWKEDIDRQNGVINEAAQNNDFGPEVRVLLNSLRDKGMLNLKFYGVLWTIGATLAIYVPLIPYMMFIVAAVGWFLLVIEAIVAAPILAVSFIIPTGEELGKIGHGLMLLLNIMLRPTLMIFGFILAARVYKAVIVLVNYSIVGNFANLNTGTSNYAWVAIVAFYGAFIVSLSNKCFSLIYLVPDKILRWMGGGPEHTDASQELGQVKGSLSKGADTINKIAATHGIKEIDRLRNRIPPAANNVLPGPNPHGRRDDE